MDRDSVHFRHLVKLVDADDTSVGEDHCACFESAIARLLVGCDRRRQTDAGRATTGGGDGERGSVEDETEHLTLGGTRVADHEDVDVTTQVSSVRQVLLDTAEEKQEHRLLDVIGTVDRRCERLPQEFVRILALRDFADLAYVVVAQGLLRDAGAGLGREQDDVVGDDQGSAQDVVRSPVDELRVGEYSLEMGATTCTSTERTVHSDDLEAVTRLATVDEVVLEHDLDTPRKLSRRCALRHLLNRHHLVVDESRQAVLNLERVVVCVGLRVGGGGNGCAGCRCGREPVGVDAGVEVGRCRAVVHRLLHLWSDEVACEFSCVNQDRCPAITRGAGTHIA